MNTLTIKTHTKNSDQNFGTTIQKKLRKLLNKYKNVFTDKGT